MAAPSRQDVARRKCWAIGCLIPRIDCERTMGAVKGAATDALSLRLATQQRVHRGRSNRRVNGRVNGCSKGCHKGRNKGRGGKRTKSSKAHECWTPTCRHSTIFPRLVDQGRSFRFAGSVCSASFAAIVSLASAALSLEACRAPLVSTCGWALQARDGLRPLSGARKRPFCLRIRVCDRKTAGPRL